MNATLFTDGGARGNPGPAGIGYVLTLQGSEPVLHGEYIGETTNNQAEYKALLFGLKKAQELDIQHIECFLDSELVVRQLNGQYKVKNQDLLPLFTEVKTLIKQFSSVSFTHIVRAKNAKADTLVNQAIDAAVK